jgi:hypothetical protein
MGIESDTKSFTFTTLENGGGLAKLEYAFTSKLTDS